MNMYGTAVLLPVCFLALYFILEAGEWGLAMALPLIGKSKEENQAVLKAYRPGLDGNELWLFMGIYMLYEAIPTLGGSSAMMSLEIFAALAVLGMILRFIGSFAGKTFASRFFTQLNGILALLAAAFLGLAVGNLLNGEQSTFITGLGILCAVWTVLGAFQVGTLCGAVKISNPLGERMRASFLVSCIPAVIVFVLLALGIRLDADYSDGYSGIFVTCLLCSAAFFIVSFVLTRKRWVKAGLTSIYFSVLFASGLVAGAAFFLIPSGFVMDLNRLKEGMDAIPGSAVLAAALIWTAVSFIYRLARKHIDYKWEDHI